MIQNTLEMNRSGRMKKKIKSILLVKLTSSNNHINNYEIDNFPIPIHCNCKELIADTVRQYMDDPNENTLSKIDALVYSAYGITDSESVNDECTTKALLTKGKDTWGYKLYCDIQPILPSVTIEDCEAIINNNASIKDICFQKEQKLSKFEERVAYQIECKYKKLSQQEVLNHTTFKLSELDLEMISAVPPGGSWKDIPIQTVEKSKRLTKINETGGRTTLYGRIDYDKPSYTITTYFNRPGNGTYVHPHFDRVISVREAARFQTFPDSYYFCGNKTEMLKQVGNAVPVLLAYSIGRAIKEKTGCHISVDLFSGAGGMTYGFELAGIKASVATDIMESACTTLKTNNPQIPVVCGDITKDEIKQEIIRRGKEANADIICGGPPCQGFSLAGLRMKDDPRNQLFRHFVDIVSGIKPKIIVFENVEGILSYEGGETYRNIIELFSELGYYTEGRKLSANEYCVPQRRKRVIILCTRKDIGIKPESIYPEIITKEDKVQITARETIYDLEAIPCGECAVYKEGYSSDLIKYFRGEISADDYYEMTKKRLR